MIITRTPHRISFFGGGTDYPSWYTKHGGKVLGAAIDKYCYISCRELPPFFDNKYRVVYKKTESTRTIEEIEHPAVRGILKKFNLECGLEIHHDGDIPARSGMGSSSAFTVGLTKALYGFSGKIISKEDLTKEAIDMEQNVLKENVGSQDQAFAAHGGFNKIEFLQSGEAVVNPVIMAHEKKEIFQSRLMLFFTGLSRIASEIAGDQIKNTDANTDTLHQMSSLVEDALNILNSSQDDLSDFGTLLNDTWKLKKELSNKITNSEINDIYDVAIAKGALGGKLLGAGGGGFILLYVEPERQAAIKEAFKNLVHVPFKFTLTGSDIVFYQPEY